MLMFCLTLLFRPQVSFGDSNSSSILDGCGVGCFMSIRVCPDGMDNNLKFKIRLNTTSKIVKYSFYFKQNKINVEKKEFKSNNR